MRTRAKRPKSKAQPRVAAPARHLQVFAAASVRDLEPYRSAKREWSQRLLGPAVRAQGARALTAATPAPQQNVVGVGIGEKIVDGNATGIRCLKFLVRAKYPESQILPTNLLPNEVHGLPVDVEEVGTFRLLRKPRKPRVHPSAAPNPRVKIRPAQPGCSVGFQDPAGAFTMAGTFGAVVNDDGGTYILSNNHVLADENRLPAGAPIFQPGLLDGGNPSTDQIATLTKFVELKADQNNQVDAAIAQVLKTSLVIRDILQIGPPSGVGQAALDMVVHKFGRTTSYRAGRVTSIDTDVAVQYDAGTYTFESQMIIVGLDNQSFSDAGDSGSLILERQSQTAVGLLFAGSASHTIGNHIGNVLDALGVTLA